MISLKTHKLMDQEDPLKHFRKNFFNQKDEIYLDGNSLGKMPRNIPEILGKTINNQWGGKLIRSWNESWLELPNRLSEKYAKLLNSSAEEIVFGESTTVRLYQILLALIQSGNYPDNIITDNLNFPKVKAFFSIATSKSFSSLVIFSPFIIYIHVYFL